MSSNTGRSTERRPNVTPEPLPTWLNTKPRGNPAPDTRDLARSIERFEMVLGR